MTVLTSLDGTELARIGVDRALPDQVHTLSAVEAVSAGATDVVVGRPIIASPDPLAPAKAMVRQLEEQSAHNLKPEACRLGWCSSLRNPCI